jgi:hypothetical protein
LPSFIHESAVSKRGRRRWDGIDFDVWGDFNFDSRTHYTATVTSRGWMAGKLMNDAKTELVGEHIGECPQ